MRILLSNLSCERGSGGVPRRLMMSQSSRNEDIISDGTKGRFMWDMTAKQSGFRLTFYLLNQRCKRYAQRVGKSV